MFAGQVTSIEDLRVLAKRRIPPMFFDYVESGSWSEATCRSNRADLDKIQFRQRVARNIADRSLSTTMVGEPVTMPVALAPTGLTGMLYPDGEIEAAKAAEAFGVPFTLSTMSICSIEDVAESVTKPFWFQLYVMRDRQFMDRLIGRAKSAGVSALVLTLDLQVMAQRHRDIKNGLSAPPRLNASTLLSLAGRPRWCIGMLRTPRRTFRNIAGHVEGLGNVQSLASWTADQFDPTLSWDDVKRIRDRWGGKLILKGILDPEDAELAAQTGAEALIVSNHGGRQLDGALSSVSALPAIAQAVGTRMEVLMDSGVRSGQDVLKALALGARGVFIGRAFLYGLGAFGEAGVRLCLGLIQKELDTTMALCGVRDISDVDPSVLASVPE